MSDTTYNWIRKIPGSLLEQDEIPLLGTPPSFPWDTLVTHLSKTFPEAKVSVKASEPKWLPENELLSGLGTPTKFLNMTLSSQEGTLYWAISQDELSRLMETLLGIVVTDPEYLDGFHHFLALEAINAVRQTYSIQLLSEDNKPTDTQLVFDIYLTVNGHSFNGRLFMDPILRKSIKNFYYKETEKELFNSDLAEKINVFASIEAGRTTLTTKEWSKVKQGDFVVVDQCTLKPGEKKGRVMFSYKGKQLFIAKLNEDGTVKLSERSLYNEVNMDNKEPEEEFEEEEFEEEDEFEVEEETEGETEEEAIAESKPEEAAPIKVATVPSEKKDPNDIPLNIVIELARIQMPFKTLMNLQPGNLLELEINPEKSVDLVVNGNRIAKGELLQIGETLGVRILEK